MERHTRYEHVQQAAVRTNVSVMMTTLVLLTTWAVLAGNSGVERPRSYNVHEWCRNYVKNRKPILMTTGPYKNNVVGYCIDIVYNYIITLGVEEGCTRLRDMIRPKHLFSSYFGYIGTARMVHAVICLADTPDWPPTTPTPSTTPFSPIIDTAEERIQPIPQCGRSESLKAQFQTMLTTYQTRISRQRAFQKRIIGGAEVNDCSMVPWQVQLRIGDFLCGGSIISDRHILTASHCLQDVRRRRDVKVIVSETHLFDQHSFRQEVSIRNMTQHDDFNSVHFVSDVAVVTLEDPIVFNNPCLEIICMNPDFQFDGKLCLVSGWGREEVGGSMSSTLKMVMLRTYHGEKCNTEFGIQDADYVYDKEQMICAGHKEGGRDSCKGDSGGPLVCLDNSTGSFVQVGVVSYGTGCGDAALPGVYSKVAYFHDWISKIMAENSYSTDED